MMPEAKTEAQALAHMQGVFENVAERAVARVSVDVEEIDRSVAAGVPAMVKW